MNRFRIGRNVALLVVGLAGIIHQTVIEHGADRPALLVLFAGMIGVPLTLARDEKRRNGNGGKA